MIRGSGLRKPSGCIGAALPVRLARPGCDAGGLHLWGHASEAPPHDLGRVEDGLSRRRRGRHGQCGPRNAEHPRRARVSRSTRSRRLRRASRMGTEVSFGDKTAEDPRTSTLSISPAGTSPCSPSGRSATKIYAPKAAAAGCVVIDNSSLYRYGPGRAADRARSERRRDRRATPSKNIIANPNCSTAQMVVALKPLHDRARIKRVVVSTYQSVSGAGKEGMDELLEPDQGHLRPGRRRSRRRSSPSRSPST